MKNGGDQTRKKLMTEALKLFTTRPYDKVTYNDLEQVMGLSRGAIVYHIKNKENLFREIVSMFVFKNNTLTALDEKQRATLKSTIDNFMDELAKEQKYWSELGIGNVNYALVNIQMSAYSVLPEMLEYAGNWYRQECDIWQEVIERAIAAGEVRKVDPKIFAELFEDAYLGASYASLPNDSGYNVERVRHKLHSLYDTIIKE